MMKKYVLAAVVAATMLGCGDEDEKTLIKWDCSGDCDTYGVCAAAQSDAQGIARCTGPYAGCKPMGDICACPDGASSCGIYIPVNY